MKTLFSLLLINLAGLCLPSWAEDKPGPHGGDVRTGESFQVEVVIQSSRRFKVYLLDASAKHPKVTKSTVFASLKRKGEESKMACLAQKDAFECSLPKPFELKKGDEIILSASRDGAAAASVKYDYPLHFSALDS